MARNGTAHPAVPDERRLRLLERMMRPETRTLVCAQVSHAVPQAPHELVEEAFQEACLLAANGCHGRSEAEAVTWLRTTTIRKLCRALRRAQRRHEQPTDWTDEQLPGQPAVQAADEEAIERERERELAEVVRTVCDKLSARQRQVAALHSHGLSGRQIAEHMRTSERRVKHLKHETLTQARQALAEAAGGGCERGERLIGRLAFGLASPRERTEAQLHLPACERCGALYQRLELWHETVAVLLPVPAAAQLDPGLLHAALHKAGDALALAKQQLADAAGHAKQQTAAAYARAVEYTPLASVRPGAAATAIAGCLALGGGAAGYCIDQQVNPVSGLVDAVQAAPEHTKPDRRQVQRAAEQQPPDPPQLPAAPPDPPAPPPTSTPPTPEPQSTPPAAAPAPPPPAPTPVGVQFGEPTNPAPATPSTAAPAPAPTEPAPAPASGGGDLYGP